VKVKVKQVKKSLIHFSGKSPKVKKVKSESDYFSLSNVWVGVSGGVCVQALCGVDGCIRICELLYGLTII